MKKYLIYTTTPGGIYQKYYDTLEEANDAAKYNWEKLSEFEKEKTTIMVGWVTPEMIDEDLQYDDNDDWWEMCSEFDQNDDCLEFGN